MNNDRKHNRPKYSLEFKQDAVKLVLEKGYSQEQAADHLTISLSALGRWVRAEGKSRSQQPTADSKETGIECGGSRRINPIAQGK